ncbi:MAG: hypothetical protein WC979_08675 [Candidatus Pacearchaeota archaeon]|jgi:hypothetical protein
MGWKDWPLWLKGGIISSLIYIVPEIIHFIVVLLLFYHIGSSFLTLFLILTYLINILINLPTLFFLGLFGIKSYTLEIHWGTVGDWFSLSTPNLLLIISSILVYFMIGAFIGWLIGRRRK